MADIPQTKFNTPWNVATIEEQLNDCASAKGPDESLTERLDRIDEEKIAFKNIYGQGIAIPEHADLNDYGATDNLPIGQYYSANAARTETLSNRPFSGSGFRLEVVSLSSTNKQQRLYPVSSGIAASCFYIRSKTTSGWASWYKIQGEEVESISPSTAIASRDMTQSFYESALNQEEMEDDT